MVVARSTLNFKKIRKLNHSNTHFIITLQKVTVEQSHVHCPKHSKSFNCIRTRFFNDFSAILTQIYMRDVDKLAWGENSDARIGGRAEVSAPQNRTRKGEYIWHNSMRSYKATELSIRKESRKIGFYQNISFDFVVQPVSNLLWIWRLIPFDRNRLKFFGTFSFCWTAGLYPCFFILVFILTTAVYNGYSKNAHETILWILYYVFMSQYKFKLNRNRKHRICLKLL